MNLNYRQINLINLQNMIASSTACKENAFTFRYRKQWFPKETPMILLMKTCSSVNLFQKKKMLWRHNGSGAKCSNPALGVIGPQTIRKRKTRPSEELWTKLKVNQTFFIPPFQICNHSSICVKSSNSSNDLSQLFWVTFSYLWTTRLDAKRERFRWMSETKKNLTSLLQPLHVVACAQKHKQLCILIHFWTLQQTLAWVNGGWDPWAACCWDFCCWAPDSQLITTKDILL